MNASLRPKVTVIVTNSGSGTALKYALESVLWQSFKNFEVWIIGVQSDSQTEEITNLFGDPRVLWHNLPPGSSSEEMLITEGIRRARGEYVAYVNANDLWLPNHLEVLLDYLETHDYDCAYSVMQSVSPDNETKVTIPMWPEADIFPEITSMMQRKSSMEEFRWKINSPGHSWFDKAEFFRWAKSENVLVGIVPITTCVKFIQGEFEDSELGLQPLYIDRLRRDPDFINKELSSLLIRAEHALHTLSEKTNIFNLTKAFLAPLLSFNWGRAMQFFRQKNHEANKTHGEVDTPVSIDKPAMAKQSSENLFSKASN